MMRYFVQSCLLFLTLGMPDNGEEEVCTELPFQQEEGQQVPRAIDGWELRHEWDDGCNSLYAVRGEQKELMMHSGRPCRANALENAFAYVRFTMYDVRFINNVCIAQNF